MDLDLIVVKHFLDKRAPEISDGTHEVRLCETSKVLLLAGAKTVYLGSTKYSRKMDVAMVTSEGPCRTIKYERER